VISWSEILEWNLKTAVSLVFVSCHFSVPSWLSISVHKCHAYTLFHYDDPCLCGVTDLLCLLQTLQLDLGNGKLVYRWWNIIFHMMSMSLYVGLASLVQPCCSSLLLWHYRVLDCNQGLNQILSRYIFHFTLSVSCKGPVVGGFWPYWCH